jgi:2-isopropylmalate synthase
MNHLKYRPFPAISLPGRVWPGNSISKAPKWCSVDLRDGNQSLETPMTLAQKLRFFKFLTEMGFKEIEVGFPSASETEFLFVRELIEKKLIPNDVSIQVLVQSREHLIRSTFESLAGAENAIVHLYNNTAPLWRDVVFGKTREEITELALTGARLFNKLADEYGRERFIFEYSPESFSQTEMDFALTVCNAVIDEWQGRRVIINLPLTVEMATPNVYADQIEFMCGNLRNRENIVVSLHAHNDRGTGVAATELGLMAGADRVEGTLFGNGERTGNADIVTLAMNLYSQGIDPLLDFSRIDAIIKEYEVATSLPVHARHPYAGELVYTAFSGSHQDAINKGFARRKTQPDGLWAIPYLPIDPRDVGRDYAPIVRFNSQSGRGGAAFILEQSFGIVLPKRMKEDFGPIVIAASDASGKGFTPEDIYQLFKATYINLSSPLELVRFREMGDEPTRVEAVLKGNGGETTITGEGGGLVEAFRNALAAHIGRDFEIVYYNEHSMEHGAKSKAITYIEISANGKTYFGAGVSGNISLSSLRAVVSAVNKLLG